MIDPYDLNQEQFDAVVALLTEQRELINRYWHDAFVQMDDFTNEGVVASGSWPFQVNVLQFEGAPIASVFPVEGATGWADTTMMHVDAPHPNCAYKWMEWSFNPKLQGDLAAWFGSVPAVPAACKGNELLTDTVVPSTASITSIRSGSGARRPLNAVMAVVAVFLIASGSNLRWDH